MWTTRLKTDVPVGAKFTDTVYTHPASHPASMITNLPTGKKVARLVIGTATAGWTEADCDYLCDGTADHTEINAAITALPATGGEIVILDGTYNITATINVNKSNTSIRGNGSSTILKRMSNIDVVKLTSVTKCKIENLQVDGNKTGYTAQNNCIYAYSSSYNTITGVICTSTSACSIYLDKSDNNIVMDNLCVDGTMRAGICLRASDRNTIVGNACINSSKGIYIDYYSTDNVVTGMLAVATFMVFTYQKLQLTTLSLVTPATIILVGECIL